jgi:hypothetical protein
MAKYFAKSTAKRKVHLATDSNYKTGSTTEKIRTYCNKCPLRKVVEYTVSPDMDKNYNKKYTLYNLVLF